MVFINKAFKTMNLEFGKGFDYMNLTNMCKFYLAFKNLDALP